MELCCNHSATTDDKASFFNMFSTEEQAPTYSILNEAQIRHRLENDISTVSATISEPRASAIVLLRRFDWNLTKLFDHWFDDQLRLRSALGLFSEPITVPSDSICGICFEPYGSSAAATSASCGHLFCRSCWSKYISESINDGTAGCLTLTCPSPSCTAAVGEDMVEALVESHSDKERFSRILLRSYLDHSYQRKRIKWCPSPECFHAFDFTDVLAAGAGEQEYSDPHRDFSVKCRCSRHFCWMCGGEAHRPVSCSAAARWAPESSAPDAATRRWILANTRPCPNCWRPIEKGGSGGCDSLACPAPCGHRFCWRCLHPRLDLDLHVCSNAEVAARTETTMTRHEAFYLAEWARSSKLIRKAEENLEALKKSSGLDREASLGIVLRAWEKMIECRRSLQWSYVYGYSYFPGYERPEKKRFLDHIQRQAESWVERLQGFCSEEVKNIGDFTKLSDLTFAVGDYFENFLRALEDGLPEVSPDCASGGASGYTPPFCESRHLSALVNL